MTPRNRFTFYHASLPGGFKVVKAPAGWRTVKSSLERSEFGGVVEYFKGSFQWYGTSVETIRQIEDEFGPDAQIGVTIEEAWQTGIWTLEFTGMLKPVQIEDMAVGRKFYKALVPIVQQDFWIKFLNRVDSPVSLTGAVDVEGNARTAILKTVLPLKSQMLRQNFKRAINYNDNSGSNPFSVFTGPIGATSYLIFDNYNTELDEIEERNEYGIQASSELPMDFLKSTWAPKYRGSYRLKTTIYWNLIFNAATNVDLSWWLVYGKDGSYTTTQIGSTVSTAGVVTLSNELAPEVIDVTFDIAEGDRIYIYGELSINAPRNLTYFCDFDTDPGVTFTPVYTQLELIADTLFKDSEADAYLVRDAAESILSKITCQDNVLVSSLLSINDKGAPKWNAILRGKHNRGNSFTEADFSMSFREFWDSFSKLYNLGLSYDKVNGVNKIRIEELSYFYNPAPVVNIGGITEIVRKYDLEKFFKTIEVGFEKWSSESSGGMDDPQTKRTLVSNLVSFGTDYKILIKWVTASASLERSRRNRVELGKDDRLDEDILLYALTTDLEPEFGDDFTVTNLLNPQFRANIRHSAMRVLYRHLNVINPGVNLVGDKFAFNKGEGNYKTTSRIDDLADYEYTGNFVNEAADYVTTSDPRLWIPKIYECKFGLSYDDWNLIKNNRHNALGLSRTSSNYAPFHIINLDWDRHRQKSEGIYLQATPTSL